ncbi:type IV pilin-like G/H family protein [Trichocoleus sp. FACHB-591]|uniref:type IV pilin-like G/H family protein n=1 Tax=Trichocoleus sp. FACHB-591 TaxID=2692872 RepID=UPI001684FBC1|nr:type IV pilin-like G/H family protein [Trichocoleus sp. FACHB-591]MBD2094286.1 type IV pilin-like G/H family protein [Trichocoleus sp. FACHB-591]
MNRFLALAAITLPAAAFIFLKPCIFLGMACKHMEGEAKSLTETTNRAQQAYYLEHGRLASSSKALGLGYPSKTDWNEYPFQNTPTSAIFYAVPIGSMASDRKGYVGAVFLDQKVEEKANPEELPLKNIICEARGPKATLAIKPTLRNGSPICPEGSAQTKVPR